MSDSVTIDFNLPVPLFPLPNCVMLPHATVPLHIFEPRYRAMLKDVLDSRGLIAMATFEGDDWKEHYEGSPPVRPCVCVGYVVKHDQLADGRYNLLLQGLCRARIAREVRSDPYRQAMLRPMESGQSMDIDLSDQRERIESLLNDPLLKELASVSAIHNWLSGEIPTAALVDLSIMTVCPEVEDRYAMLAEPDAQARARWLERYLRQTRRTLETAERFKPVEQPDGSSLN